MTKYYKQEQYNAAFDRCVDVMARLIQKYGPQVLKQAGARDAEIAGERCSMEKSEKAA